MFDGFLSLLLFLLIFLLSIFISTKLVLNQIKVLFSELYLEIKANNVEVRFIKCQIEEVIRLIEKTNENKNLNAISEEDREERWNRIRKAFDKQEKENDASR